MNYIMPIWVFNPFEMIVEHVSQDTEKKHHKTIFRPKYNLISLNERIWIHLKVSYPHL